MEKWLPDKTKFKDSMGKYITQSLFLENGYNTDLAVYTLTDTDKEYKGKIYPSLRRLYLEHMDIGEYDFANTYLWGWDHWQRICNNSLMVEAVAAWREELEVKVRAAAIRSIMISSFDSYNAARYMADGGWKTKRGRPSKAELERERRIREKAAKAADDDGDRIVPFMKREDNG